jgi:hypothetical protein
MPNYSGIWTEQAVMQANGAGNWPNAPGAPTIGTATSTSGTTVSVTFTAPTFAGIPAVITSYTVTSSPGGLTGTGASSPITVSGLTEGTPYTFTVQATNASGTGPASAASNSVTPVQINYIEEMFSTWLYTGTGANQTITNGIDIVGKGGLVWTKPRSIADVHALFDTLRGVNNAIQTQTTSVQSTLPNSLTAFNSSGFSLGSDGAGIVNASGQTYASWTFREQAKFFDIVTYTGTGSARTIAHNLGSVPGCIMIKCTSATESWAVWHNSLTNAFSVSTNYLILNGTEAQQSSTNRFNGTQITSTEFGVKTDGNVNGSGKTYVAYIFAHNAGGFGLTGTDNVISCASYTGNGSATGPVVTLGYEPQWLLIKRQSSADNWNIIDNMRGLTVGGNDARLVPNTAAEEAITNAVSPTATGFQLTTTDSQFNASGSTYIYVAIRRGPMKVPTSGTSVFTPIAYTGNATARTLTTNFPVDLNTSFYRPGYSGNTYFFDRLRGTYQLLSSSAAAEGDQPGFGFASNTGITLGTSGFNGSGETYINYMMRRAPSFFDEVCYTGTGVAGQTISHNLGAVPELMIMKRRNAGLPWGVYYGDNTDYLILNTTAATADDIEFWNDTSPTASVFSLGVSSTTNDTGSPFVAYLFATCPGVSKVGSYTGTATTKQIDCGFTAGARFVLIKRTDSTGDWYVWDSARGIIAGNDPYLLLNSTAAEVTNTDYVDTYNAGFEISSTAPAAINASGGTFIFLAIA